MLDEENLNGNSDTELGAGDGEYDQDLEESENDRNSQGNKSDSVLDDINEDDELEEKEESDSEVDESSDSTISEKEPLSWNEDAEDVDKVEDDNLETVDSERIRLDEESCKEKDERSSLNNVEIDQKIDSEVKLQSSFKSTDANKLNISSFKNIKQKVVGGRAPAYISLLGPESFSKSAQEPWPNDVKLYQPYEVEQILLPDNASCLAVQAFLRMCQLQYQVVPRANAEAMSPTGRVPFIKCGAFVVSELEGIVQFVNNRGITLTDKLDNEAKSDMRAYMCLVHNVLEKAELYVCWMDNETYNDVTSVRHGSVFPWPLNHIQNWTKRRAVMKNLKVWNWYDKKIEEVFQEVENACQALSDRLDDKEYFFGSRTELDALVFGHLYSMCTCNFWHNQFRNILKKFQPLLRHCERICQLTGNEMECINDLMQSELG